MNLSFLRSGIYRLEFIGIGIEIFSRSVNLAWEISGMLGWDPPLTRPLEKHISN